MLPGLFADRYTPTRSLRIRQEGPVVNGKVVLGPQICRRARGADFECLSVAARMVLWPAGKLVVMGEAKLRRLRRTIETETRLYSFRGEFWR